MSSLRLSLSAMSKPGCTPTLQSQMGLFPSSLSKAASSLLAYFTMVLNFFLCQMIFYFCGDLLTENCSFLFISSFTLSIFCSFIILKTSCTSVFKSPVTIKGLCKCMGFSVPNPCIHVLLGTF